MKLSSTRAEHTALTALALSTIFFLVTLILSGWSHSFAVASAAWFMGGTALVWFVLVIQFHLRCLAQQEKLDMAQLAKTGSGATIFQTQEAQTELFATAQKRQAFFEKWFLAIFALLIAFYEAGIGVYLFTKYNPADEILINQPLINAAFMAGLAFISFLIARYAIGMSVELEWRPLRAGGAYLLVSAIIYFAIAIGLTLAQFKSPAVIKIEGWIPPILLGLLGIETIFNLIMDIYRPRLKGQYSRAAFESRLLGILSEPGGILHTAAEAIDYQFGFKVSQTWFFQLLSKTIVPLILFSIITLYVLSCFAVIGTEEEGIIERFGKPLAEHRIESGIHFKLPWPIEIVYKHPVKRIQQVNVGFLPDEGAAPKPLLWNVSHFKEEYDLLVATKASAQYEEGGAVPVSIIRASIPVQYYIKDLYSFIYKNKDAAKLLEAICYREIVQFVASSTIETSDEEGKESLIGAGRLAAAERLKNKIQKRADENELGVEIVFLGLQGFHPPPEVAADYEAVVASVQKKQANILIAMAERDKTLAALAGSVDKANKLYNLAEQYQDTEEKAEQSSDEKASDMIDKAFSSVDGDIFAALGQAKSDAFEKSTAAKADSERFKGQLKAYRASKRIYTNEQKLAMLEEALSPIRKFVVATDPYDSQVVIVDLQEKLTPDLYEFGGIEEKKK